MREEERGGNRVANPGAKQGPDRTTRTSQSMSVSSNGEFEAA